MIWLHKVDGSPLLVNEDHIVCVEGERDSVLTLSQGEKVRVEESAEEIARRVAEWRRLTHAMEWIPGETSGGE